MPEDLFDEPERRAAEKLAAARRFLARGKLRDALDALNLAIQLAPGRPEAFRDRAAVFERMGLAPQAEADRRRAAELTAAGPPLGEDEPQEQAVSEGQEDIGRPTEPPPAPPRERSKPRPYEPPPEYVHEPLATDIPREEGRGPGLGAAVFTIAVALLFAAGIAGGIAFVVLSLGDDDEPSPSATPLGSGVATGGGSATATVEPTTSGNVSTSGDPYSLASLVSAWKGKGMEVKAGGVSQGFSGFKTAPSEVTMTRGGATATAAVFVYKTREEALAEWDLVPGIRPQPKGSHTVPAHVSAWWNANVVVVLTMDPSGLGPDALDGLLNLGS